MIKALATRGKRKIVMLGLSRRNCELLLAGKPIHIHLSELGVTGPEVVLCAGETEEAIVEEFQALGMLPAAAASKPKHRRGS